MELAKTTVNEKILNHFYWMNVRRKRAIKVLGRSKKAVILSIGKSLVPGAAGL
jgi:hypothetical protein